MGETAQTDQEYYDFLRGRILPDKHGDDDEGHLTFLLKDGRIEVQIEGDMSYIVYPDGRPYDTVPTSDVVDDEPADEESEGGETAQTDQEYYDFLRGRISPDKGGDDGEGHLTFLLKDGRIEVQIEGDMSYIVYPDGRPYDTVPTSNVVDDEPADEESADEEPADEEFVE